MAKKTTKNTTKTIEQILWDSANELRGNLDAAEYKSVVLGLVFLKYLNDCFKTKYDALVAEGEGFEEDPDEYIGDNIFFVPADARWEKIVQSALTAEIGVTVDAAMEALERENKQLKGILPKNYARPELDKRRLGNVVDIFENNLHFTGAEARDVLGRVYEYFLGEFAREEGKKGGEFYTPECVVRTIVEIIQPYKGKIFDPACGSGGMFVQSSKFIERHRGNINQISVYGQELNSNTWRLAQMNLAIRGIEANFGSSYADSFHDDKHPFLKADFVMANPPFNISKWGGDQLRDDPRWQYGLPPEGNANFAWMQHMLYHLAEDGRIGLVLANGSLSSEQGGEGEIRKNIINADLVEGIVTMPEHLFYNVQIPCCLWFLSKNKSQPGKTLFIDARNLGYMKDRTHRELDPDKDIKKITDAFDAFRIGKDVTEPGFAAVATTADIEKENFVLAPGRYVAIANKQVFKEDFLLRYETLNREISENLSRKISDLYAIRRVFASIGAKIDDLMQYVFNSWFVDFSALPQDELVESDFGLIPKGWEHTTLGTITVQCSKKVKTRQDVKVLSPVTSGQLMLSEEHFSKQVYSKELSKYLLVEQGAFAYNPARVNIGSIGLNDFPFDGCVSPVYVVFKAAPKYELFIKYFIKTPRFRDEVSLRAIGGVRQTLSYADFSLIEVILPPEDVIDSFNELVNSVFNTVEISNNESLRDSLLHNFIC